MTCSVHKTHARLMWRSPAYTFHYLWAKLLWRVDDWRHRDD